MEFQPGFECEIQPMPVCSVDGHSDAAPFLYSTTASTRIHGRKAYFNTPDYQFSVVPAYDNGAPLCLIQLSAKAFVENNYELMDSERLRDTIAQVRHDLKTRGVKGNFDQAEIKRVDVAQNIQLEEPVPHYAPIFAAAQGLKRASKKDFGSGAHQVSTGSWQGIFYPKDEEMRAKKAQGPMCPPNTLRAELRALDSAEVRRRFGLNEATVAQMRAAWPSLRAAHKQMVRAHVFNHSGNIFMASQTDFLGAIEATRGGRSHFAATAMVVFAERLVAEQGLTAAKQFLRDNLDGNQRVNRDRDKLLDAAHARLQLDGSAPSGRAMRELFRELESKLLGD